MDELSNPRAKRVRRRSCIVLRNRKEIHKAKDKPCADCGVKYPYYVMQFDHRPGTIKMKSNTRIKGKEHRAFGGSNSLKLGLVQLLIEIAKCDVVCANCHHIRTYVRIYGK